MNNDPISDILMKLQGNCPNCGTVLTFKESALLAKDNGIKEDAVMCHNCKKAYTVNLTLHSMTFLDEINTNNNNSGNEETDYAVDFKDFIDKNDYVNSMKILKEWQTKYPDDANAYYAGIIMAVGNEEVSYDDLVLLKEVGDKSTPINKNLVDWYKTKSDTALNIVKNNEKEKENYASEFKKLFESEKYNEATSLQKKWMNKCSDDANAYYAQILLTSNNNNTSITDLENTKNIGDNKTAIDKDLAEWYKNEANNTLTKKINDKIMNDNSIQNNAMANNQQTAYNNPNYGQQAGYNNNVMNNNMPNNNVMPPANNEDNSIFAKLFYKKDAYTHEYRISKTKTISILLFLLIFITMLVDLTLGYPNYYIEDHLANILASIFLSLIVTVPVFIVGFIISYILDKDKEKNAYQMNQQMNYNNVQGYNPQNNIPQNNIPQNNIPQNNIPQNNIPQNNVTKNTTTKQEEQKNIQENKYSESDNLGTRHDTIEKANGYWLGERFHMDIKPPFTLYVFENPKDAEEALLELPYIHKANDTGNLICDKVFQFGYYKVSENNYEAIICGKDLTLNEFELAEEAFKKHNGKLKNNLKPEETATETTTTTNTSKGNGVRYRETIKKNQFTYECYDADTKEEAQEFLKGKPVTERLYYICVYTPEGDYGRDIDGIYQM